MLLHEKQHIAAHDQHIKLLFVLLRALFWWNPISHLFVGELDAVLELRCDNAVTSRLDEAESLGYFGAMLNAMKQMLPRAERVMSAASALIGGVSESKANIKQRFEVYRNSSKRRSRRARGAICVLVFLVFVASYFVIVQPAYSPPEEDMAGTDVVAVNEEAFIIYNGEEYWLFIENEKVMEIATEELSEFPYSTFPIYDGGN